MANSNAVSSTLPSRDYHCKICDLYLDTIESLEVHLQYHKENLYVKWGMQNAQNDNDNNNGSKLKGETTISAPADSSDNMITKSSSEFQQRATPETSSQFPHPATPQSYHSAPSPYQNSEQNSFSPNQQFGNNQYSHTSFSQNQHSDQLNWDQTQYNQDFNKSNRFHPYNMQERVSQVSSSSPLYGQPLNQPTPSPSPNQCDKCGFVCESAMQLSEHCNSAHANNVQSNQPPNMTYQQYQSKQYVGFPNESVKVKEEQEESSDILDLDSQKVVYQANEGEAITSPYEQPVSQARDAHTVPLMSWEQQKVYGGAQVNGDSYKNQKLFPEQKYSFNNQDKFIPAHHEQKPFMQQEQKLYPLVQMPPIADYSSGTVPNNQDMKPPYRPYDSPAAPQITSTQPANSTSAPLPPIGGKGANWKSNEARRPKTYNCTACNKWFTSSGHLKRHYNTTLHKNAVRSSGQPDPATLPISNHHHPTRETIQARAQQSAEANVQSPGSEESHGVDESSMQGPYSSQNFDRSHRSAMPSKSPYSHLQQGNIDNSFMSNNPLANHPLPQQVGSHPLNIGSPPGIENHINITSPKGTTITSSGNPPNGEAGPSVTQNHHLRGLLSVSTSNITTPVLAQSTPTLTPHTLPPFSHLAVNPYSPRSTDHLGATVPDPTHTPLYLGQNFQQTIAQNYPNGMAPHVMDMAINNLPIANQATFGECLPEEADYEPEMSEELTGRLPSFAQLHTQRFGIYVSNYLSSPDVGGSVTPDESPAGYIVIDSTKTIKEEEINFDPESMNVCSYGYEMKSIKLEDYNEHAETSEMQVIKMENIMDYANKENYETEMQSPASPESAKTEYESNGSPSISSTVPGTPLVENNQISKATPTSVHKCFECDKIFNKACYLTQHNKTFHSGAKPYKCKRCGKRFSDDVSYEEHYSKHTENKPFKCSLCPKSFNHKTDLRRHMCLHSGTKPFACDSCGKAFIRKDHMLKHCETHRKVNMRTVRRVKPEEKFGSIVIQYPA